MDWQAFRLSIELALLTALLLIPLGIIMTYWLQTQSRLVNQSFQVVFTLPLVLPPTVIGYYLLVGLGRGSWLGNYVYQWTHISLVFSFAGIWLASLLFNIPFAWLPILRAFETIPQDLKDASKTCGLSTWQTLLKIELPLAWKGILTGFIMTFTHTLGEFGVVLMVGGNIPNETRTISIAIYDQMQTLQMDQAGAMALMLLLVSFVTILVTQFFLYRPNHLQRQVT
jgi:molybdate transport system permease protein